MLTRLKLDVPPEDCPWMNLVDQDGNQLVRVDLCSDQPDEIICKVAKAICKSAGIEFENPFEC